MGRRDRCQWDGGPLGWAKAGQSVHASGLSRPPPHVPHPRAHMHEPLHTRTLCMCMCMCMRVSRSAKAQWRRRRRRHGRVRCDAKRPVCAMCNAKPGEIAIRDPRSELRKRGGRQEKTGRRIHNPTGDKHTLWTGRRAREQESSGRVAVVVACFAVAAAAVMATANCARAVKILYHIRLR
jgi:hypothetical protein